MATSEWNLSLYCASDAEFRAYCDKIIDEFIAVGLVQTSDTGQINTATVARPTAVNQDAGYAIFRFNDALQATKPVFIKLVFGSILSAPIAVSGGDNFGLTRIKVQTGTGTDGAGNLTGKLSLARCLSYYSTTALPVTNTPAAALQANQHLLSGANNRICFVRGANSDHEESQNPLAGTAQAAGTSCKKHSFFSVERSKEPDGTDSEDGIIFISAGTMNETPNTFAYFHQYIPFLRPNARQHNAFFPCFYLGDNAFKSSLNYNTISAMPFYPFEGGQMLNPGINQLGFWKTDFVWEGVGVPVQMYGSSRLYRPINGDLFRTMLGSASGMTADSRMMILWE